MVLTICVWGQGPERCTATTGRAAAPATLRGGGGTSVRHNQKSPAPTLNPCSLATSYYTIQQHKFSHNLQRYILAKCRLRYLVSLSRRSDDAWAPTDTC